MTTFDPAINFGIGTVLLPYTAADTSIDLVTGDGARFPDPGVVGAYNVTWWNASAYANPSDDPSREIVRVTAKLVDNLTITRAQEGTSASNKNAALATYKISLGFTKKTYDDITTAINGINPSVWIPMETITFTASSAIQTTADFPNASTAKQYKILVDVTASAASQYIAMRTNGSTSTGSGHYVGGTRQYEGTPGAVFNSLGYWKILSSGDTAGNHCTGEILIGAQDGNNDRLPVACTLSQTVITSSSTSSIGWAHADTTYDYLRNISFFADQNITGTFSIFQRQ